MNRLFSVLPKFVCVSAVALMFCACEKKVDEFVDYTQLYYDNYVWPMDDIRIDENPSDDIKALVRRVDLRYPMKMSDTLEVTILEFKSDVYALDYYMNSGRFQGIVPILRGSFLEQSIRSGSRIFIFKHDSFRRYERSDLETYVHQFPNARHGGFPQEFLSLPFEHREPGHTSILTKYFLGVKAYFPVLAQVYRDADLQWNVARSWDLVEENDFIAWGRQLNIVQPKGIYRETSTLYFNAGEGVNGMATRLPGGRVVAVWGYLDWTDLERKFFTASDRVYGARY
jgi:hypothetical protein